MEKYNLNQTIAAISTSTAEAGIGIVRLNGQEALKISDKIFRSKDGKKPSAYKTYTIHYGWIIDTKHNSQGTSQNENNVIDEVLLTVMRAPFSFTKEDVVEINCHGGIIALRAVLDLVLRNGCRLAEPGEFTKRAFLNGRIDLTQAEAVLDVIRAKTDLALKTGTEQLKGSLSKQINKIRGLILDVLTVLEANIDFPQEELKRLELNGLGKKISQARGIIKEILATAKHGRVLREGISVVICGRPNVGKSSLLNALLKQERSIVTPIAGTTRDTIEEIIDIKGIPIKIVDTAGILEPRDLIEKKAVERSKNYIKSADLVIIVFDASKKLNKDDFVLIKKLKGKLKIAVLNKIDLKDKIEKNMLQKEFKDLVMISAKKMKNLNLLEDAIVDAVYKERIVLKQEVLITNLRHIQALREAEKLIEGSLNSLDNRLSLEFISQDLKESLNFFDDILGKRFSEDLLERIFNDFCIGK